MAKRRNGEFLSVFPSPRLPVTLTLSLLVGLLVPASVHAQDTTRPALPDLAPREFEIRGQLELSLPTLERQPLSGFGTPTLVPPLPPAHPPSIEDYARAEGTPRALPETAAAPTLKVAPPATGTFAAAGGRYFSRVGLARLTLPFTDHETLNFRFDYRGSNGYAPFESQPELETPFDAFDADLGFETRHGSVTAGLDLDGFLETYTLYGARLTDPGSLFDDENPQPDRRGLGGGGALWLRTGGDTPVALRVGYAETRYATDRYDDDELWDTRRTEQRLTFDGGLRAFLGHRLATLDARVTVSGFEPGGSIENDLTTVDGGFSYQVGSSTAFDLTLGGRALGAFTQTNNGYDTLLYPSLDLRLNWYPHPAFNVFIQNTPGVDAPTLSDLFQEAPYLVPEPRLAPTIRLVDATGGVRLFGGPVEVELHAGFRQMPQFLFFEQTPFSEYERGFTAARYGEARVLHGGATLSLRPEGSGLHVSIGGSIRQGRLVDEDTVIPYFSPFVGRGLLSYSFLDGRGLIQLNGTFEGPRYVDREETLRLDPFFDLDAKLTYYLNSSLGWVLHLENMSGFTERWRSYPRPPLVVMTGLRVRW